KEKKQQHLVKIFSKKRFLRRGAAGIRAKYLALPNTCDLCLAATKGRCPEGAEGFIFPPPEEALPQAATMFAQKCDRH
ncbi:MAG TPA: hypothetical protein H9812_05275, partial [Candidatus Gallimonas intestinigallinarum]|nr:hypothetical protein [Candidatus Gallimonas intestinigallinarum]